MLLYQVLAYTKQKFELPHGSYSVSDIQNYFEYITKKT